MRSGGFTDSYFYAIRKFTSFCIPSHSFKSSRKNPQACSLGSSVSLKTWLPSITPNGITIFTTETSFTLISSGHRATDRDEIKGQPLFGIKSIR